MTFRALLIGLALGCLVAATTYFNDHVIRQTSMISNHLPAAVVGLCVVLTLAINPLLGLIRGMRQLSAGELALVLAMELAVCGWPGAAFLGRMNNLLVLPAHKAHIMTDWQSVGVLSYVPGGPPEVADGFVTDWPALIEKLRAEDDPVAADLVGRLAEYDQQRLADANQSVAPVPESLRSAILRAINAGLADPAFTHVLDPDPDAPASPHDRRALRRLNRDLLDARWSDVLTPRPHGSGVMFADGEDVPDLTVPLITGAGLGEDMTPAEVPWSAWWPTYRLWIGAGLCSALAVLCLMVIVHPVWSRRELLPYPTVKLVELLTARQPGRLLPEIAYSRPFWWGCGSVVAIHAINGLAMWFPALPGIPLRIDLMGLSVLFPYASQERGFPHLFAPTIYPSVIGFAYLITTRVSLSVGLSLVGWVFLSGFFMRMASVLDNDRYVAATAGPSMRFGAFIGMTVMIAYYGRRYYWSVIRAGVGLGDKTELPPGVVWAVRGLLLFAAAAVWILCHYGALHPVWAIALIGMVLMASLVLARINVETGLFYVQPDWYPAMLLAGLVGYEAMGPSGLIVLMTGSYLLMPEPQNGLAPYLLNGLALGDRITHASPRRLSLTLGGMVVIGLLVAVAALLLVQYRYGFDVRDHVAVRQPVKLFGNAAQVILDMDAVGTLQQVVGQSPTERLGNIRLDPVVLGWIGIGLVLVTACAFAQLRLSWWFIHPVMFLVWGTWPSFKFGVSFLLAAAVKHAVIRLGGAQAYHAVRPVMIGLIVADLLMVLVWSAVGAIYFWWTGLTPPSPSILPG